MAEYHRMLAERLEDLGITRYTCVVCERCIEIGPDWLRVISKGNQAVDHRGGMLDVLEPSVEPLLPPRRH